MITVEEQLLSLLLVGKFYFHQKFDKLNSLNCDLDHQFCYNGQKMHKWVSCHHCLTGKFERTLIHETGGQTQRLWQKIQVWFQVTAELII